MRLLGWGSMSLTEVPADEVLLDWYRSEPHRWREHRVAFEAKNPGLSEVQLAQGSLRDYRGPLFIRKSTGSGVFFDDYPTTWYKAEVPLGVLAGATPMNCWDLPYARTVREVAVEHEELKLIRVTRAQLKHRPVLATKSIQARPMLLDGYHRAAGLINSNEQQPIPVFYCVCPRIDDWHFYWEPAK